MIHPQGLCSRIGCFGRSISEAVEAIKKAVMVLLLVVFAVGLVFAGEVLFGRSDVGALVAMIVLCVGLMIYLTGGLRITVALAREKLHDWAHKPPEADQR